MSPSFFLRGPGFPLASAPAICVIICQDRSGLSRSLQEVWGREDDPFSRTLDVHISRVRSRLGLGSLSSIRLRSVHGFGYQLITYAAPGQE
ncbi:MAG: helix-turn-helix domain-containing protein, partial [Betaproteobacteria bacterium]